MQLLDLMMLQVSLLLLMMARLSDGPYRVV
jgi:hypothetical protein